jgi:hypothetical protein
VLVVVDVVDDAVGDGVTVTVVADGGWDGVAGLSVD